MQPPMGATLSVGALSGGAPFWEFGRIWEEGSGNGPTCGVHYPGTLRDCCRGLWRRGIFLYGSSAGEPGGRAPLLGSLKVVRVGSGDGYSASWGLSWVTWSGLTDRGLWFMVERGSGGVAPLSLWELCEGNLEGGLPCWGPWRLGGLREWTYLWGSLPRNSERLL